MNTALTTNSYISVSPARKAFAFKPCYKTACRVAIGINTVLASAFLLSFPLLRIADAKCPVEVVKPAANSVVTTALSETQCNRSNVYVVNRKRAGYSFAANRTYRHDRFISYNLSSEGFKKAHRNWRFDY